MFLIIVLFGLLALGLAFVTYLQSDLNQSTPPKPAPPAIVAPAAAREPEQKSAGAADSPPDAAASASGSPTTTLTTTPSTTSTTTTTGASASMPTPGQAEAVEQLRTALKEATEALSKASAENNDPAAPRQP